MIRHIYTVTCDACNKCESSFPGSTEHEARMIAVDCGWTRRRMQNGSAWDLCPECGDRFGECPIVV